MLLTAEAVARLGSVRDSRTAPWREVQRARILLSFHSGETIAQISRSVGMTRKSVGKWIAKALAVGAEAAAAPLTAARRTGSAPICENVLMEKFDRITWSADQMNGQPCIRGMRVTVRRVIEAVALYPDREDLFRNYPELEAEDVRQALAFAAANLEDSAVETSAA